MDLATEELPMPLPPPTFLAVRLPISGLPRSLAGAAGGEGCSACRLWTLRQTVRACAGEVYVLGLPHLRAWTIQGNLANDKSKLAGP